MATNPLPQGIDELLTLAEDAADGAALHETAIGLFVILSTGDQAGSNPVTITRT